MEKISTCLREGKCNKHQHCADDEHSAIRKLKPVSFFGADHRATPLSQMRSDILSEKRNH